MNEEGGQASGVEVPLENAPLLQPASSPSESTPEELQTIATVDEGASHEQVGSTVQGASATPQEGASSAPVQVVPQHKPKRTRVKDEIPRGGAANHADKVFVGGISWQAHETDLTNFFCQYGHVADAKIIRDSVTGKSKGYGFVTFADEQIATAVKGVGFVELLGRKCQVGDAVRGIGRSVGSPSPSAPSSPAHPGFFPSYPPIPVHPSSYASPHSAPPLPPPAPAERRVFVGGLPRQADESTLHYFFSQWGPVVEVKIIYDNQRVSKGYGFVTFHNLQTAALVKSYVTVEFMGRQMNVGDAMRGMAGQMRKRSTAPPGTSSSAQHFLNEGMRYAPTPSYGAPIPMQGYQGISGYAGYPTGYAPVDFAPPPPGYAGMPTGFPGVPGYLGGGYGYPPGGAQFAGLDYSATYSQGFQTGYYVQAVPEACRQAAEVPTMTITSVESSRSPSKAAGNHAVTRTTVPIPPAHVGAFSAPDSASLKAFSAQSEAQVTLLPAAEGIPDRHLEITGAQSQVVSAQKLVQAFFASSSA